LDDDLDPDLVHDDSDEIVFLRVNGNSFEVKSGDDYLPSNSETTFTRLDLSSSSLLQIPPSFTTRNNSSALEQRAFVESAINDLVINGCVTEVFEAPIIINPLSVSIQKSGKKRLILDFRLVNKFLYKCRFRCEDLWPIAKEILKPGDFMFTFDLN